MVDPREVEQMRKFQAILLGGVAPEPETRSVKESFQTPRAEIGSSTDLVKDMKAILQRFNTTQEAVNEHVDDQVSRLRETAQDDRRLRDALITQKTPRGVQMGSWEISVNEDKNVKTYDVKNVHTGEAIAHDLSLYESATALTKLLNFHVGLNSPQVRKLLDLEDRYARVRQDASTFRTRMKQRSESGDFARSAIAEDRYNECRTAALALREELIALNHRL